MWPSFLSLLSKITGEGYQSTIQGFACSFAGLASITGLILGGLLYEMLAGGSFLIVGVVIFVVFAHLQKYIIFGLGMYFV